MSETVVTESQFRDVLASVENEKNAVKLDLGGFLFFFRFFSSFSFIFFGFVLLLLWRDGLSVVIERLM